MYEFVFFITIIVIVSYIDIKKQLIPDLLILPSIAIMILLKWLDESLYMENAVAVGIVSAVFLLPLIINMDFGGGDLRFGIFCSLFVGLKGIGFFILFAGIIHMIILGVIRKKSFAFAPAMSIAALLAYYLGGVL